MSKRNLTGILLMTPLLAGLIYLILQTSNHEVWGGGVWEKWLVGQVGFSLSEAHLMVYYFRKTVHFFFYGCFALLFQHYFRYWGVNRPAAFLGILIVTIIAAMDEYYQSLVSFRTGKIGDVLLDLSGTVVITAVAAWRRRRSVNQ